MMPSRPISIIATLIVLGVILLPMAESRIQSQEKVDNTQEITSISNSKTDMDFALPIQNGLVSSRFGPRIHPIMRQKEFHKGVDIAAPKGTIVYAAADGKVLDAVAEYNPKKGIGKYITLRHINGFTTCYGQLDEILVQKGQIVKRGQVIAKVGSTGASTSPHLHFEVLENEKAVNPENLIDFKELKTLKKDDSQNNKIGLIKPG